MSNSKLVALRISRLTAVLFLGLLLPAVLLFQAHQAMGRMSEIASDGNDIASVLKSLPAGVQQLRSQNDYAILSIAIMEASNQRTMQVKQRMKMSVMHIGFAVVSLGLMMLVLGLEAGGVDITTGQSPQSLALNLKTTSTAVTAIVLGASMAAAGALIPNPYTTVSVPSYAPVANLAADERLLKLRSMATECVAEAPKHVLSTCLQNAIVSTLADRK